MTHSDQYTRLAHDTKDGYDLNKMPRTQAAVAATLERAGETPENAQRMATEAVSTVTAPSAPTDAKSAAFKPSSLSSAVCAEVESRKQVPEHLHGAMKRSLIKVIEAQAPPASCALSADEVTAIHSLPFVRSCLLDYAGRPVDETADAVVRAIAAQVLALNASPSTPEAIGVAEAAGGDAFREAIEDFLTAQDALDNREYMGINAEPYDVLMRRVKEARRDLDAALFMKSGDRRAKDAARYRWLRQRHIDGAQDPSDVLTDKQLESLERVYATPTPAVAVPASRPKCRDCADFGPICPNSGKPCGATTTPAAPPAPIEPVRAHYCRMPDGRCGICGGDWSVCGCDGMLKRAAKGGAS